MKNEHMATKEGMKDNSKHRPQKKSFVPSFVARMQREHGWREGRQSMKGERKGSLDRLISGLRMEKGEAVMDDELFERLVREAKGERAEDAAAEGTAGGGGKSGETKESTRPEGRGCCSPGVLHSGY
jgi:hypothetical protein